MAHPCDYPSQKDISRLRHSPLTPRKIIMDQASHGRILVAQFLRDNPTWAIDSLVSYCLTYYRDYLVDHSVIADCMKDYINGKSST